MPGKTPNGYPTPLPGDEINAIQGTVKSLAEYVDTRAPMRQAMGAGGYTTDGSGRILLNVGFDVVGGVAITRQAGYACVKTDGAPQGQIYFTAYYTPTGSAVGGAFIIMEYIVFGTWAT